MRATILVSGLLLAACGGGAPKDDGTVKATVGGSSTTETALGKLDAGNAACADKPEFVPIYAGATILTCSAADIAATGRLSGSIIYTTTAKPAAVLAWVKQAAAKAGLEKRLETETMFSAGEGQKRTLAIFVEAKDPGTHVVTNWGQAH